MLSTQRGQNKYEEVILDEKNAHSYSRRRRFSTSGLVEGECGSDEGGSVDGVSSSANGSTSYF